MIAVAGFGVGSPGVALAEDGVPVSAELPVTDPVYKAAPRDQASPSVAWNGTNYMAVWRDGRANDLGTNEVYAGRLAADGTVLDRAGIPLATSDHGAQDRPAIAWNGSMYLVAWTGPTVWALRVGSDGEPLDSEPFRVSSANAQIAGVVWDGTNFLVVWGGSQVRAARVSPSGSVLDPEGFAVSSTWGAVPSVAFDGTNSLIVWQYGSDGAIDVYGRLVSTAATFAGEPFAVSSGTGDQTSPSAIWNGSTYLVAWHDKRVATNPDIYGSFVSTAGAVSHADGLLLAGTTSHERAPALAWNGTDHVLAFQETTTDGERIAAQRLTSAGAPTGSRLDLGQTDGDWWGARLAVGGSTVTAVWTDGAPDSDIKARRMTSSGSLPDSAPVVVSTSTDFQANAAVAWNGSAYLVVWEQSRTRTGTATDIYGARLTPDGTRLDGAGFAISTATGWQSNPRVTWDGANFLVVWQDNRSDESDVYGARVTAAGAVLDEGGIPVAATSDQELTPVVASAGGSSFVAWAQRTGAHGYSSIRGSIVSAAGIVSAGAIRLSRDEPVSAQSPAIASAAGKYLVAWDEWNSSSEYDVRGALVSGTGGAQPSFEISAHSRAQQQPTVGSDGAGFFVAWQDKRAGNTGYTGDYDLYGTRVSAAGAVQDAAGVAISTAAAGQLDGAIAYTGAHFVAVWQDERNGSDEDVAATLITREGVVAQPSGLTVAGSTRRENRPAVAPGAPRSAGIAYQRASPERAAGGVTRAYLRVLNDGLPVNPTLTSPSHTLRQWSRDRTITVQWSGGSTAGSGIDGYSYSWTTTPTTFPDETKDAEETATTTTSPSLFDRSSWYFHLRTRDNAGTWSAPSHLGPFYVDATAPLGVRLEGTALSKPFQNATSFGISWRGMDRYSHITSYDVRYNRAPYNGTFGPLVNWRMGTAARSATFAGTAGNTYCFWVRARDGAGNVSPWSGPRCTALPIDDQSLTRAGADYWVVDIAGYYRETFTHLETRGSAMVRTNVVAKQLAVLATKCPSCGSVDVYWNTTKLTSRPISLYAATRATRQVVLVPTFASVRGPGTVRIVVVSSGKDVEIDGLGVSRV